MYVPFSQMPPHSRTWIYQSNRELTEAEIEIISEKAKQFLESWTAHEQMLKASFDIRYNHFLILVIDEKTAGASGCSIDKSVHFIKSIEGELGRNLTFFDRMLFTIKKNGGVEVLSKKDFEKRCAVGEINDDSIIFNNLVDTKFALETEWQVPLKNSWHSKI